MKKYTKPIALVQDMTINAFAAGACSNAPNAIVLNSSETSCYYQDPDSFVIFFSMQCDTNDGFGIDVVNPNPNSPYAQLCYHRPLDALNFFNS